MIEPFLWCVPGGGAQAIIIAVGTSSSQATSQGPRPLRLVHAPVRTALSQLSFTHKLFELGRRTLLYRPLRKQCTAELESGLVYAPVGNYWHDDHLQLNTQATC